MNGTERKILLVEDDPVVMTLYRDRLQREGFKVLFAEDGEVTLNILSQSRPELVVLDLMLPKVNGVDVLKHIRGEARLKSIPVLILSNAYMTEMTQKAMQSGANKGMLKTECTPAKLVEAVQDMLGCETAFGLAAGKSMSGKSGAEAFVAAAAAAHADELMLRAAREEFIKDAPAEVARIRDHCLSYIKSASTPESLQQLNNLYQRVHFLTTRAGLAGCAKSAMLSSALEALLFEIMIKPAEATASALQTTAQAVDCLGRLLSKGETQAAGFSLKAKVLVVDDDAVCNYAMVAALKRAHFEPVSVEDPTVAVQMAQSVRYDIVLLDINMPVMNGFELCETLRRMPQYSETPVIFITGNGDFQNRAQGILSGGNDLITKPTSTLELILKTTMYLLQPRGRRPEPSIGVTAPLLDPVPGPLQPATPAQNGPAATRPATSPGSSVINGAKHMPAVPAEVIELFTPGNHADLPKPEASGPVRTEANHGLAPPAPDGNENESLRPATHNDVALPDWSEPWGESIASQRNSSKTGKKPDLKMETKKHTAFDEIAQVVTQILFGDENLTEMNVRLTRIALERYNVPQMQAFDEIVRGVARVIFGDENLTETNVRLTRIALERYNVSESSDHSVEANGSSDRIPRLAKVSL